MGPNEHSRISQEDMDIIAPPFLRNRLLQGFVLWLSVYWVVMAIAPLYPFDWMLENILVFFYGTLLVATYRWFRFSNTSYALFTLFMTLHLTGAHYTYAEVPFGFWLQDLLGFQRNHFDRIVHFTYGLLLAYPMRELLVRAAGVRRWSRFLAVNMILAFSGFYEVLEMWVAQIVSPELGDAYLGTQGDSWDAQRDMFLAFAGAVTSMVLTRRDWPGARRLNTSR